ncbi:hypothetical protein LCGC14_1702250 [marine sediment metagenome]|uniref:Uncharacterized protein n=1 Tax=marine sediment metagenome TaxID=412755 RepID=A0A0F9JY24_9ZZZZ
MTGSTEPAFEIRRDSRQRLQTDIADDLTVGVKVLAETDDRRVRFGVHAYAVLDIRSSMGVLRVRDIRIKWSIKNECFYIQWRQWFTGKFRGVDREGNPRKEFLDVCGPLDPQTRQNFNDSIVAVYDQILSEAKSGTLGASPSGAKLAAIRDQLVTASAAEVDEKSDTIGDVAADAATEAGATHVAAVNGADAAVTETDVAVAAADTEEVAAVETEEVVAEETAEVAVALPAAE